MEYQCIYWVSLIYLSIYLFQLTGAQEYADSIPTEGLASYSVTGMHLIVKFPFWSFGKYRVSLHFHYSQVHDDLLESNLWDKQKCIIIYYASKHYCWIELLV